jgi:DsbC/DsbD-like thiol-disulfide interchange protein
MPVSVTGLLQLMRENELWIQKSFIAVIVAAWLALLSPTPYASESTAKKPDGFGAHHQTVTVVDGGELKARIALLQARALSGQRVGVIVEFAVAPGWHVYGKPLPEEYTPTTVTFDNDLVARQNLDFPTPTPVKFELLGETLPVYQDRFRAAGYILLRQKLLPGEQRLDGTLSFQECNDNLCKMPQQVRFEIPLRIISPESAAPG